jgi:hypothetical protein
MQLMDLLEAKIVAMRARSRPAPTPVRKDPKRIHPFSKIEEL